MTKESLLSMCRSCSISVATLFLVVNVVAFAQPGASQTKPSAVSQTPTLAPKPDATGQPAPAPAPQPVSQGQAIYLVRSTLMMLNDANRSGNYTVLRDLAAPDFQSRNSAADLAQSFADLRRRNFDLFAAALLAPQFTAQPALDASGRLRLTGFFPTSPLRISFDLTFQSVAGQWRLLAVSVATPPALATQSQLDRPVSRRPSGMFYGFRVLSGTAGWRW